MGTLAKGEDPDKIVHYSGSSVFDKARLHYNELRIRSLNRIQKYEQMSYMHTYTENPTNVKFD